MHDTLTTQPMIKVKFKVYRLKDYSSDNISSFPFPFPFPCVIVLVKMDDALDEYTKNKMSYNIKCYKCIFPFEAIEFIK